MVTKKSKTSKKTKTNKKGGSLNKKDCLQKTAQQMRDNFRRTPPNQRKSVSSNLEKAKNDTKKRYPDCNKHL